MKGYEMNTINNTDKLAIFQELDRLSEIEGCEPRKPEEFTAKEYEEHTQRSYEWTRRKLNELCEKGTLEKRLYKNMYLYKIASTVGVLSEMLDTTEP